MIYTFLILFFSFLILYHLLNNTIEGFAKECAKLSNVNCANVITEENKGMIGRMKDIAKATKNGSDKSAKGLRKTRAQVKIDTARKARIKAATDGENVVNSPAMDSVVEQSKIPK